MQPERRDVAGLPAPDPVSRRHSERVHEHIRAAIVAAGGSISFAEFMQHALYAPGLGYYVAGARKFGAEGDFVTAPEVSPVFGRVVARAAAPILRQIETAEILELGAGSGALAVAMLGRLAELGALPTRYLILEVSADLEERQRQAIGALDPELAGRVEWLTGLPREFAGVVLANEVADALPVERFLKDHGEVRQLRVTLAGEDFAWQPCTAPPELGERVAAIERYVGYVLPDGYRSELSPGLGAWLGDIGASISRGVVFLLDYGVSRREYYARERDHGWLRCCFRHHAHDDPLILPGIQDLSAWVDFTTVAEAASACGLVVGAYLPQSQFLMHNGLEDELASFNSLARTEQLELSRQVKVLTLPGEMGEHFKCMVLHRGSVELSPGLSAADRAHTL